MNPASETTDRETVTVCIPTYNQASYLAGAIQSILAQDYPVDQIIISDDASTDGTPVVCERFAREIPVLRYFRQERNLGIERNVDFVLRQANSTYVVRLDSDDRLLPAYNRQLMEAMRNMPEAAYAHGDVWEIDGKGTRLQLRTLHRAAGFQSAREALIASLRGFRVTANILLFRRSALEHADYTKGRGNFAEDYHLAVSLARAGYGNVYVPESLAEYRVWVDPKGTRTQRKEQELAGLVRVFEEQIEPGFREADLAVKLVLRARRKYALRYVTSLDEGRCSPDEKARLEASLIKLGDSMALQLLIQLNRWRLGFIWRGWWWLIDALRGKVKKWLRSE